MLFQFYQETLGSQSAPIASQGTIGSYDAVAWNENAEAVAAVSGGNGAQGTRHTEKFCLAGVADGRSVGNL